MSARDALTERVKKASEVSREQVHAYIGANDYWYEQARRRPSAVRSVQELPAKLRKLAEDGVDVSSTVERFKPAKLRRTIEDRVDAARLRRNNLAERGESIVKDWKNATAVKDVEALVKTVRSADGVSEIAKGVRTWAGQYPPAATAKSTPKPAAKAANTKPVSRSAAVRKTTPRKATARKGATG